MRKPKPSGHWKHHNADECEICAKPKRYKRETLEKETLKESFKEDEDTFQNHKHVAQTFKR